MTMASVSDIRANFLNYFVSKGHREVSSSPLVPQNDPTLMFTNSGMAVQNVFTGLESRDYSTADIPEMCAGKHNDLENVGYTARHHTFFEMLGISFGDYQGTGNLAGMGAYYKGIGLDAGKLLVTVYSEDEEAAGLWRKIAGLDDSRIIRISTSDNFWSWVIPPCGPVPRFFMTMVIIFLALPALVDDGDRFIEIWNLVFAHMSRQRQNALICCARQLIQAWGLNVLRPYSG